MRITFLIPNVGFAGGNRVVAIYADRLRRRGHFVTIVSGLPPAITFREKLKSRLKGGNPPLGIGSARPYFDELGLPVRILDSKRPIADLDVPDADVVVATWWETAEWVAALSPSKGAKAYFVQHHEVFPYLPVERSRSTYFLPLKKIVISHWLAETMSTTYGDNSYSLVLNSVDTTQFFANVREKQAIPTIGFLYSTADFKAPDVHLRAINELKRLVPAVRAVAFSAQTISADFPLPNWVEFHHRPAQDHIRFLYSKCDVWMCGSRSEGFHLPPIEAMACRCPVVSTRVGGPLDIVKEGVNGFLVDVNDADGLARKAFQVLALSNNDWTSMSEAAEATARQYTWDDAATLFERALLEIAKV
jgi:glycosyltransferase involved in cell wall biosynthesis